MDLFAKTYGFISDHQIPKRVDADLLLFKNIVYLLASATEFNTESVLVVTNAEHWQSITSKWNNFMQLNLTFLELSSIQSETLHSLFANGQAKTKENATEVSAN